MVVHCSAGLGKCARPGSIEHHMLCMLAVAHFVTLVQWSSKVSRTLCKPLFLQVKSVHLLLNLLHILLMILPTRYMLCWTPAVCRLTHQRLRTSRCFCTTKHICGQVQHRPLRSRCQCWRCQVSSKCMLQLQHNQLCCCLSVFADVHIEAGGSNSHLGF
jgi:hypothetical protein